MENQKLNYPLSKLKDVVKKWLYLTADKIIDVVIGVYIANQLDTDPLWMVIIGPPSSSKTEIVQALDGNSKVVFISSLTPSTLVSGLIPKGKMEDPSLILKLDGKILVLKEFSSILSMRSEAQQEVLAQLREVYDGKYKKIFGNGKKVEWAGRVGMLAAATPAYDRHHGVIGSLGDRFLLYRNHNPEPLEMGFRAVKYVGMESQMRAELREAFNQFLNQFKSLDAVKFEVNQGVDKKIVYLASFCSYGRCAVERDRYNQTIEYIPEAEGPPRLAKQFKSLGVGIALAHGKSTIDEEVYQIIKTVGRDLIQSRRIIILQHLWNNNITEVLKGWSATNEIADAVGLPGSSAKLILEDLQLTGILNKHMKGQSEDSDKDSGRKPYQWQINELGYDLISGAQVFDSYDLNNMPF